jgi:hypothetical protein
MEVERFLNERAASLETKTPKQATLIRGLWIELEKKL